MLFLNFIVVRPATQHKNPKGKSLLSALYVGTDAVRIKTQCDTEIYLGYIDLA